MELLRKVGATKKGGGEVYPELSPLRREHDTRERRSKRCGIVE